MFWDAAAAIDRELHDGLRDLDAPLTIDLPRQGDRNLLANGFHDGVRTAESACGMDTVGSKLSQDGDSPV